MKYIRTEDRIMAFTNLPYDIDDAGNQSFQDMKIADTIEELCDRYYGVDKNGDVVDVYNGSKYSYPIRPHKWAVDGFCTKEDITINELKNRFPKGIFGAIVWFDAEGNLHIDIVAKMNNKGDLELL